MFATKPAFAIILIIAAIIIIAFSASRLMKPDPLYVEDLIEKSESMPPAPGTVHTDLIFKSDLFSRKALDLYEPLTSYTAGRAPLVVFYHGGSWIYGDKITIRIIDRFLNRMRAQGYFVASVNYTTSLLCGSADRSATALQPCAGFGIIVLHTVSPPTRSPFTAFPPEHMWP